MELLKVYLSHSRLDKEIVERLADDLRAAGVKVWIDDDLIKVGQVIPEEIQNGITSSDYVVVWLTKNAIESGWVKREWMPKYMDEISNNKISVLTCLAEDCDIPELLKSKKHANFIKGYTIGRRELFEALGINVNLGIEEVQDLFKSQVDLNKLKQVESFGKEYLLVDSVNINFETTYYVWNKNDNILEKWEKDSVRWHGPSELNTKDLRIVLESLPEICRWTRFLDD
jgi:hypothetical protein